MIISIMFKFNVCIMRMFNNIVISLHCPTMFTDISGNFAFEFWMSSIAHFYSAISIHHKFIKVRDNT